MTDDLLKYIDNHFVKESPILRELREFALQHELGYQLTHPVQTQFLCFLLKLLHAKRVIEVGAFLGYTTLAMAEVLPEDGEVITCECNESWINEAKAFWQKAGVMPKISVCLGDALQSLRDLIDKGQAGSVDFIYVDAAKKDYQGYLEVGLQLIHKQGMLAFDNVLRVTHGDVANPQTPTTRALAQFNHYILQRSDLEITLVPMYKGLLLVQKLS